MSGLTTATLGSPGAPKHDPPPPPLLLLLPAPAAVDPDAGVPAAGYSSCTTAVSSLPDRGGCRGWPPGLHRSTGEAEEVAEAERDAGAGAVDTGLFSTEVVVVVVATAVAIVYLTRCSPITPE